MTADKGLKLAIDEAGGVRALGRLLGIAHSSILTWSSAPMHHVLAIERGTGISRELLRPDIFNAPRPKNIRKS